VAASWSAAVDSGEGFQTELRLRRADGEYRWHMCHVLPETRRKAVRGWLAMFAECEDLKRAIDARNEFLSIASHELRTPLTTLLLQLEASMRSLRGGGAPTERDVRRMDSSLRQARRLERLISSLLEVALIDAGRLELQLEEFDLAETVRGCVERIDELATRSGSVVRFAGPDRCAVRWDPLRTEQAITNLLSNAVKYGNGQPIDISVEETPSGVRIRVTDHGIGISPEDQARLFQPFERAVSARNYGGLGMGLYITRRVVEAHGGTIGVTSQSGAGATFAIELPRHATAADAPAPPSPSA
jgi:signal transduction histidine kinase